MKTPPLWRLVQRQNFTQMGALIQFLNLSLDNQKELLLNSQFPLNLPRRLAEKIEKNNLQDPIFLQFVPIQKETLKQSGFQLDPVQDVSFSKTKKLLHKYQGRALIITTGACAMHCRFCFRQHFPYETTKTQFETELLYIQNNPSVTEVILSGGDPLSLSDETLGILLQELNKIPHVRRVRFHSRFLIGIPERVDDSFLRTLSEFQKEIIFVLHANHPKEIDADVQSALKKMKEHNVLLLNQSVLLKHVNDRPDLLIALSEKLLETGVLPYYLHQLDPVEGAAHFEVPLTQGKALMKELKKKLPGYGTPRWVREEPGEPSKTALIDT